MNFEHKIVLKPGAIPVKQKVRDVTLSIRQDLRLYLDHLCADKIIEPAVLLSGSVLWLSLNKKMETFVCVWTCVL